MTKQLRQRAIGDSCQGGPCLEMAESSFLHLNLQGLVDTKCMIFPQILENTIYVSHQVKSSKEYLEFMKQSHGPLGIPLPNKVQTTIWWVSAGRLEL